MDPLSPLSSLDMFSPRLVVMFHSCKTDILQGGAPNYTHTHTHTDTDISGWRLATCKRTVGSFHDPLMVRWPFISSFSSSTSSLASRGTGNFKVSMFEMIRYFFIDGSSAIRLDELYRYNITLSELADGGKSQTSHE